MRRWQELQPPEKKLEEKDRLLGFLTLHGVFTEYSGVIPGLGSLSDNEIKQRSFVAH